MTQRVRVLRFRGFNSRVFFTHHLNGNESRYLKVQLERFLLPHNTKMALSTILPCSLTAMLFVMKATQMSKAFQTDNPRNSRCFYTFQCNLA